MLSTAPVCTLELGHNSSGIRLSRRIDASRPRCDGAVGSDVDVVDDAHAVAQPVGAAERDRLVDGRQAERLARVNREAGVVVSHVFEGVEVPGRRVAGLGARDVEPDDALVAEPDRQLGDLARPRGVPHRGDQAAHRDRAARRLPPPSRRRRTRPAPRRRPRRATARGRCAVRGRTGSRRRPRSRRPGPPRTRRPPGAAPPASASPRPCARTAPGSARAIRCARRCGRTSPSRRRRWRAGPRSRSARRGRGRSRGAVHRRGGRAAAPWAPAGWTPGSTGSSCRYPIDDRAARSRGPRRRRSSRRPSPPSRRRNAPGCRCRA